MSQDSRYQLTKAPLSLEGVGWQAHRDRSSAGSPPTPSAAGLTSRPPCTWLQEAMGISQTQEGCPSSASPSVSLFLYSGCRGYFPGGGNKVQEGLNYFSLITCVSCEIRNSRREAEHKTLLGNQKGNLKSVKCAILRSQIFPET